jgi:hypothetical protein
LNEDMSAPPAMSSTSARLPADFKFDRDDANAR